VARLYAQLLGGVESWGMCRLFASKVYEGEAADSKSAAEPTEKVLR
jgi:hypothetical protein